ncbi:hypothetical protein KAR91_85295 [Candidatus Pacearchaeota archaeon]|nr:hypothetical protein [Candidatus Pacearchaeota archaeon]
MVNDTYEYYCYCCGKLYRETASSKPTQCECCTSTDIQDQYHKSNLIATINPTIDDDESEGYCVGSRWINITFGSVFICVDNTNGAAVWVRSISEFDWIEEFNLNPDYMPVDGSGNKIYNSNCALWAGGGETVSKVDASKIRITSTGGIGDGFELTTLHAINPVTHTYLEIRWKYEQDTTDFSPEFTITDSNLAWVKYFYLYKKNATEITVEVSDDSGVSSESYDVAHVLTSEVEFCVKIKDGEIKFFIDDVLKATFTDSEKIWHDITDGVVLDIYGANDTEASRYVDIDYIKFLPGRSF